MTTERRRTTSEEHIPDASRKHAPDANERCSSIGLPITILTLLPISSYTCNTARTHSTPNFNRDGLVLWLNELEDPTMTHSAYYMPSMHMDATGQSEFVPYQHEYEMGQGNGSGSSSM